MDCNLGEPLPPILTLPPEVRGQIFNLLKSQAAVKCREVCHQFREDVDNYVEFKALLDETIGNEGGWFLPRILKLRLKEITVRSLFGPPDLFGESDTGGSLLLKYPNLLRKISLPNSKISVDNLHHILVQSSESLGTVELSLSPPTSTSCTELTVIPQRYNWSHLKKLILVLSTLPPPDSTDYVLGPPSALKDGTIPLLLLTSKFNVLSTLRLHIRCLGFKQVSQLTALTLGVIGESSRTLRIFDFDLIQGHGVPSLEERPLADSDANTIDTEKLLKVVSIEETRIVNSTAIGIQHWTELISNQKNLRSLETDILPAPAALFRQIILNNVTSLVSLDLGDLTLDFDDETAAIVPFDVSIFSGCIYLKKLTLDRNSIIRRRGDIDTHPPELINLYNLPSSLLELNMNYFLVSSVDFLLLFLPNVLPNLGSLTLTQCGNSGPFGVDGSVLQQIISLPSVSFIEISPLNFSDEEETLKLNLILSTFGYPLGHSYFQLRRVDQQSEEQYNESGSSDLSDF